MKKPASIIEETLRNALSEAREKGRADAFSGLDACIRDIEKAAKGIKANPLASLIVMASAEGLRLLRDHAE